MMRTFSILKAQMRTEISSSTVKKIIPNITVMTNIIIDDMKGKMENGNEIAFCQSDR